MCVCVCVAVGIISVVDKQKVHMFLSGNKYVIFPFSKGDEIQKSDHIFTRSSCGSVAIPLCNEDFES